MKKYEELKTIISNMEDDTQKFYDGNNSAGTRVRKFLQDVKKCANEMRTEIQEIRKNKK